MFPWQQLHWPVTGKERRKGRELERERGRRWEGKEEEQRREGEQRGHGGRPGKQDGNGEGGGDRERGKGREECDPRKGQKESRDFNLRLCIHLCTRNVLASLTKGHTSLPVTTSRHAHLVNTGKRRRGPTSRPQKGQYEPTGLAGFNPEGKQQEKEKEWRRRVCTRAAS